MLPGLHTRAGKIHACFVRNGVLRSCRAARGCTVAHTTAAYKVSHAVQSVVCAPLATPRLAHTSTGSRRSSLSPTSQKKPADAMAALISADHWEAGNMRLQQPCKAGSRTAGLRPYLHRQAWRVVQPQLRLHHGTALTTRHLADTSNSGAAASHTAQLLHVQRCCHKHVCMRHSCFGGPLPNCQASPHLKTPGACSGMSDCSTLATTSRCCAVLRPFIISLLTRTKSSYVASSGTCTPAAQHSHSTACRIVGCSWQPPRFSESNAAAGCEATSSAAASAERASLAFLAGGVSVAQPAAAGPVPCCAHLPAGLPSSG